MPDADDLERAVARTADLVLKLASLAERYEATASSAERVAVLREAMSRGQASLVALGSAADAGRRTPATA